MAKSSISASALPATNQSIKANQNKSRSLTDHTRGYFLKHPTSVLPPLICHGAGTVDNPTPVRRILTNLPSIQAVLLNINIYS